MNQESNESKMIIETAKKLFQTYGFRRVTIDEIAVSLKISKKTIYKHFASKDELILATVFSIMDYFIGELKAKMSEEIGVIETFSGLMETVQRFGFQITPAMAEDMQSMPHIWEKVDAKRKEGLRNYAVVIERGKKRGEVREDISTEFMIRFLIQMISSIATPQTIIELNMSPFEMTQNLFKIFTFGVLTDKGRESAGKNEPKRS